MRSFDALIVPRFKYPRTTEYGQLQSELKTRKATDPVFSSSRIQGELILTVLTSLIVNRRVALTELNKESKLQ